MTEPFRVRTLALDLPAVAGAFGRRLHDAGVPVTAERAGWFAQALAVVEPISRRRLYWTARAAFVSDRAQVRAFDDVFFSVFGAASVRGCLRTRSRSGRNRAGTGGRAAAKRRERRRATIGRDPLERIHADPA